MLDVGGLETAFGERVRCVLGDADSERHLANALKVPWGEVLVVLANTEVEDERVVVLCVAEEERETGERDSLPCLCGINDVVERELAEAGLESRNKTVGLTRWVARAGLERVALCVLVGCQLQPCGA